MSRRALSLLATFAALLAAGAPAASGAALDPKQLTLRLPDLPIGFEVDEPDCDLPQRLDGYDPQNPAERRVLRGCDRVFAPGWTAGVPRWFVASSALVFATPEEPRARLAHPRAFAQWFAGLGTLTLVERGLAIGDGGVLMRDQLDSGVVVWRSGSIVGAITYVGRGGFAANRAAALRLAAVQQARIANPTPLAPSDFDDTEVPLDDPRLDVPVLWLGPRLAAGGSLPAVRLLATERAVRADRRQGLRVVMTYGRRDPERPTVQITLLHPSALDRRAARRELRAIRRDLCTRTTRLDVPDGSGTLFTSPPRCRPELSERAWALVRLPDVAIRILVDRECFRCGGGAAGYATPAGMRAIVRALAPRLTTAAP